LNFGLSPAGAAAVGVYLTASTDDPGAPPS
jgi:hypothetical protein